MDLQVSKIRTRVVESGNSKLVSYHELRSYGAFNFEIPNEQSCTDDAGTLKFDKCRGYANSERLNFSIRRIQKIGNKIEKIARADEI